MARDYSPTHFFLHVPNRLLKRYFHERHGVLREIDFDSLAEDRGGAEAVFQALIKLNDAKQAAIEAECQDIESMAFHGGITALIEEATSFPHNNTAFPEAINQFDGEYGKAMWAYVEYPLYWLAATSILHAQDVSDFYWKRRNDIPHLRPLVEQEDANRLGEKLKDYFQTKEGRGRHCKVDVFRRREKEYFFAYLSDFGQASPEWDNDILASRPRLPAFEIIFVYSQSEGTLDIYAPGNSKYVPDLQKIFAGTILELIDLKDFAGNDSAYDLDLLADRDFAFKPPPNSGVQSVVVRRLRLTLMSGGKRRVTVEAEPKNNPKAVYDLMERLKLPPFHVANAEIVATFDAPVHGTRTKKRNFRISYPDSCNLRHEGRDRILRQMLAASGIELSEVVATTEEEEPTTV